MALSRRQFFSRFLNPIDKSNPDRVARYAVIENHVRTNLLPYDFAITAEQEKELLAAVRTALESAPNDELFSPYIRGRLEEVVESKIQPWREESHLQYQAERIKEVRLSAPDYVSTFLSFQATPATVDLLKQRFAMDDVKLLETTLKDKVRAWIVEMPDEELLQYDVVSVKDLVFAQLRSWC